MKILCISDATDTLIYSLQAPLRYKDVDLVISAGDLPLRYYDYIETILKKDVYYVYGNHNLDNFARNVQKKTDIYSLSLPLGGGTLLENRVMNLKRHNLLIAGLGGSMLYNYGDSQYTESQMRRRIRKLVPFLLYNKKKYGRYLDILVTHAPPRGLGDGEDLCHRGFECFLSFMDKYKPRYLLHGHVHLDDMNAPREILYNETKVVNVYKNHIIEDEFLGGGL